MRFVDYRAPAELCQGLAVFWWHVRRKMAAALAGGDPQAVGCFAATILEAVVATIFVVYDWPLPPGSQRLDVLYSLPLPSERRDLLAACAGVRGYRGMYGEYSHPQGHTMPDPAVLAIAGLAPPEDPHAGGEG